MIDTIADLLYRFKEREAELLGRQGVKHPTTIGDMYEGLTRNILDRALPLGLDLSVTNGFIFNDEGETSRQVDCMLVTGEGQPIPYTDAMRYHVHQVIAVIEVKKNLYSATLADSYENLLSVVKVARPKTLRIKLLEDAFRSITRRTLPSKNELGNLPFNLQMIYHALLVDLILPVRIVLGYNGFSTEEALRDSFYAYLNEHIRQGGFGPTSLPSLVVCGQYSLVKLNGMPFAGPMQDEYWCVYGSCRHNPLKLILELVWTRLSYLHDVSSEIFGDDLLVEGINHFLSAICIQQDNLAGWVYKADQIAEKFLAEGKLSSVWEPTFLNEAQFTMVNSLCLKGEIDTTEPEFVEYLTRRDYIVDHFVKALVDTGLVTFEDNKLKLLTDECRCVILPSGDFIAAEDKSGRLMRWVNKFTEGWRASKGVNTHHV